MGDLTGATYEWLKERISALPRDEGTFLTEAEVARLTGASRTPVRESLMRLESEGLVERIPKRGAFVPPLSDSEIRQVMRAREMIELWGVDQFLSAGRTEALDELDAVLAEQEASAEDHKRFIDLDSDFHHVIVAASGNQVIAHFHGELRDRQVRMGLHAVKVSEYRTGIILAEHRRIVDGLRRSDAAHARTATSDHLARTLHVMLS
jgi:DNA-binding GntR family transcriptional regulator